MATDLIEIDASKPGADAIQRAASVVRRGGVIAVPSDGLYVLVADPFNLQAAVRVFGAKGRDYNRSLPMFVRDILMAEELASELNSRFFVLARRFWPGPLTLIVPASARVPLKVTGNTGRLAMRQPNSAVPVALLEYLDQPLIATSANISGQPTCRTGIETFAIMDGRVDLVLDGGMCPGLGNTTVDVTEPYWKLIREGAISEKEIAECLSRK